MQKYTDEELLARATQVISGCYLTSHFPLDYDNMYDEDLLVFIEDHAWEPLENLPAESVLNMITQAAYYMVEFLKEYKDK